MSEVETMPAGATAKAFLFETFKGHLNAYLMPADGEADGQAYSGYQWRDEDGDIAGGLKRVYHTVDDALAAARAHGRFRGVERLPPGM